MISLLNTKLNIVKLCSTLIQFKVPLTLPHKEKI